MANEEPRRAPAAPEPEQQPAPEQPEEEYAVGSSDKEGVVVYSSVEGSGKDDSAPAEEEAPDAGRKAVQGPPNNKALGLGGNK